MSATESPRSPPGLKEHETWYTEDEFIVFLCSKRTFVLLKRVKFIRTQYSTNFQHMLWNKIAIIPHTLVLRFLQVYSCLRRILKVGHTFWPIPVLLPSCCWLFGLHCLYGEDKYLMLWTVQAVHSLQSIHYNMVCIIMCYTNSSNTCNKAVHLI